MTADAPRSGWQRERWLLVATLVATLIAGGALFAPAARADSGPTRELEEAQQAYARGEYRAVIKWLTPLLYPRIRLPAEEQALTAYKLLGISHVFEKDRAEAVKQFNAILALRPDYQLDSVVDPLAAVELFEAVKKRNAHKLQQIRERMEQEQRRRQEAQREAERRRRVAREVVVERNTLRRSYWVNLLPFGAGQFQNGHRIKGALVLGLQAALGGVSVGTAIYYQASFSGTLTAGSAEEQTARRVATTQVVSGALFFAALAYGIIDSLAYFEPETTHERRYTRKTARAAGVAGGLSRISLAPCAGPGGVVGLSMSARFR